MITPHPKTDPLPAPPAADQPSLVGKVLSGRYRIEEQLGSGGMGAVYRAEHTLMHKRLAIKVLHPEMTRLPEVVARFEREAMAAAHIDHPNVAAATDFGKLDDGSFFLVLEYVEGISLREALADGPLSPLRVVHIGRQIAAALARAHSLGIVHRDLKPENVMLVQRDGDPDFVKVLDFGIAKVPVQELSHARDSKHKTLTRAGMVYGTPEYMAPEQALGQEVDARADLYALGIILYELLAGRRPFEAESPVTLLGMQVTQPPPSFRTSAPDVDVLPELEALIMELLEKEASRRPSDARQLCEALEQLEPIIKTADPHGRVLRRPTRQPIIVSAVDAIGPALVVRLTKTRQVVAGSLQRLGPAIERLRPVSRGVLAQLKPWTRRLRAWLQSPQVERIVSAVRARLPAPVRALPVHVLLVSGLGVTVVVVVSGSLLLCSQRAPLQLESLFAAEHWPPAVAAPEPAKATEEQLVGAASKGAQAVQALVVAYPSDPQPLKILARVHMAANEHLEAMHAYAKLFALSPEMRADQEVQRNVVLAAGSSEAEVSDAAFALMEEAMGSHGPDLLYAMAFEGKAKGKAQLRALRTVKSDKLKASATPAMLVAMELRLTGSCQGKYSLLERAKEHGDQRTLVQLRQLYARKGCGFLNLNDCWPCMRQNNSLSEAVGAIEARQK